MLEKRIKNKSRSTAPKDSLPFPSVILYFLVVTEFLIGIKNFLVTTIHLKGVIGLNRMD